jgi:hypothetical protein
MLSVFRHHAIRRQTPSSDHDLAAPCALGRRRANSHQAQRLDSARRSAPNAYMRATNIRLLPAKITEVLVRAFAALPPIRSDVLILQPVAEARAPLWATTDDFNVVWVGEKVGCIYRHPDCFEARQFGTPWYWGFGHPAFRVGASGHVATKEAALAAFRAAWDKLEIGQVS